MKKVLKPTKQFQNIGKFYAYNKKDTILPQDSVIGLYYISILKM